ncbi:hypothetical protein ACMFMG_010849 [Clarireedia jacksonii]
MVVKAGYQDTAPLQETNLWKLAAKELKALTSNGSHKSGLYLIEDPKYPGGPSTPKAVFAWVAKNHINGEAKVLLACGKCLRFPANATELPPIVPHLVNKNQL